MDAIEDVESKRDAVLAEMRGIRSMERGSITEQYLKVPHKGGKPVLRGPYYLMSRKEGKRTVGYRLTTPAEVELAKRGVEAHRKFAALCKEYECLTERLGELERRAGGDGAKKKALRLRSNKTGK